MAKAIVARMKEPLLSSWKQPTGAPRAVSRFAGLKQQQEKSAEQVVGSGDEEGEVAKMPVWVPHPKTGIYFPKGHESIIDDVPERAASLTETYWLRSIEGTDKPDPDLHAYTDI